MIAIPPRGSSSAYRSVRQIPGLSVAEQDTFRTCLRTLCEKYLDPQKLWKHQNAKAKTTLYQEARAEFPLLSQYEDEWPVKYVLQNFLTQLRFASKKRERTSARLGEISTKRKRLASTRSARTLKEKESSASDGIESEDEIISCDRAPSIRDEHSSKASSSRPTVDMAGDQAPRREGNEHSPNAEARALGHSRLTQESSIQADKNNAATRLSEGEDGLMYPLEEKIDEEEDVTMEETPGTQLGVASDRLPLNPTSQVPDISDRSVPRSVNPALDASASDVPGSADTQASSIPWNSLASPNVRSTPRATDGQTLSVGPGAVATHPRIDMPAPEASRTLVDPADSAPPISSSTVSRAADSANPNVTRPPAHEVAEPFVQNFLRGVLPPLATPDIVRRFMDAGIVERDDLVACSRLPQRDQLEMLRADLGLNILHSRMVRAALNQV